MFHVAVSLRYASASAFREGHRSGSSTQISGLQIFVLWRLAFLRLPHSTAVDSQMQGHFPLSITLPTTCILRLCQFLSLEEELIVQFPSQSLSSDLKQNNNSCHPASRTLLNVHVSREFSSWFARDSCKSFWFQLCHALGVKNQEILGDPYDLCPRSPCWVSAQCQYTRKCWPLGSQANS